MAGIRRVIGHWGAVLLLVLGVAGIAQGIEARLDRETIFEGETVRLTIQSEGDPGGAQPDYTPLGDDFYLGETTQRSQFTLANGRRQMTFQWDIVLEPRTTGTLTVPPLQLGQETTGPLQLTVLPRGQQSDGAEIFLEMTAAPLDPYVHGNVLLTLRLYHIDALTEGRLIEPELPDAVVERLSEDISYTAEIDGTRYRVLERRFAVFPERSGTMEVPAAGFRGRVADGGSRFNSIFDRGRRVSTRSEPLKLEVRSQPAAFPADAVWLPAQNLALTESWPEAGEMLTVGEPITRIITMQATGLLSVQLPEIAVPDQDQLRVYPDQPLSQTRSNGSEVFASREQSYALVPTAAGTLTLPEIRVPWWDTGSDELRYAVIPAREIQVAPAATSGDSDEHVPVAVPPPAPASGRPEVWWPLATVIMAVLWLATLLAWWLDRRRRPTVVSARETAQPPASVAALRKDLRRACAGNDAGAAAAALLGWARAIHSSPISNLGVLAGRVRDPELANEIRRLDRALYAGHHSDWTGQRLSALLDPGLALGDTSATTTQNSPLPPLYPG